MNIQWPPLAIGSGAVLVIIGALWKTARLRGEANKDWSSRVSAAEAGLTERAIRQLTVLRSKTDELVGVSGAPFDPMSATADPAPLLKLAKSFERCMFARRRAQQFFGALLMLGYFARWALFALLPCVILIALHFAQVLPLRGFFGWVIGVAGLAMLTGSGVLGAHFYLQDKLTDAEILSQKKDD